MRDVHLRSAVLGRPQRGQWVPHGGVEPGGQQAVHQGGRGALVRGAGGHGGHHGAVPLHRQAAQHALGRVGAAGDDGRLLLQPLGLLGQQQAVEAAVVVYLAFHLRQNSIQGYHSILCKA